MYNFRLTRDITLKHLTFIVSVIICMTHFDINLVRGRVRVARIIMRRIFFQIPKYCENIMVVYNFIITNWWIVAKRFCESCNNSCKRWKVYFCLKRCWSWLLLSLANHIKNPNNTFFFNHIKIKDNKHESI